MYMALATRESDAASVAAFRDGMREHGHVEGRSYTLVERYAEGDFVRARAMLRELAPNAVSVFLSPVQRQVRLLLRETIRAQGQAALRIGLASNAEPALQQALHDARARGVQALVVVRDFLTSALYLPIAQASRTLGLATVAEERRYPVAGALMSYGASDREQFGRAAAYVARVLKGERAGALPIEQPTRFALVVNAAAARGLGLALPGALLLRADKVIE